MSQNLILDLSLRVDNISVTCSNVSYLTRQLDRFVAGSVAENSEEVSGGVISLTRLADRPGAPSSVVLRLAAGRWI